MPLQHITIADHKLLQDVADSLAASHKILMVTGAGISTSCGIPDFRSKDGLYALIQDQRDSASPKQSEPPTPSKKRKFSDFNDDGYPSSQESTCSTTSSRVPAGTGRIKGKDLFDARVWKDADSTATFYTFIASLRKKIHEEVKETSQTHKFIRVLRDGGRLMRCYTQNIDGLEVREGLSSELSRGKGNKRRFMKKIYESPRPMQASIGPDSDFDGGCEVVPLHGDLDQLRCNLCQCLTPWDEVATEYFLEGEAPGCEACSSKAQNRRESGKRGLSVGLLRPNIVLYHEQHPSEHLLAPLPPFDMAQTPEVLIIMGTSLKVHGLMNLVRQFAKAVHARKEAGGRVIFVNRTKPSESIWNEFIDDWVAMDCDDWVVDLRTRREDLWLRQGDLDLTVTKPVAKTRKRKSGVKAPTATPGSAVMVSVLIDDSQKTSTDPEKPKKKRQRKTEPPCTPPGRVGLPTPPPSRERTTNKSVPQTVGDVQNHTPWLTEDSLTPSTKRRKIVALGHMPPPAFSPIKPFMNGDSNTPWIPPHPVALTASKKAPFRIHEDDPPTEISPIKAGSKAGLANVDFSAAGILGARSDLNGRLTVTRQVIDKVTNERSCGVGSPAPPTGGRKGVSIRDLLN